MVFKNHVTGEKRRIKQGFSWQALAFGPLYYFYVGLVRQGYLWLGVTLVLFPVFPIVWLILGFRANADLEKLYVSQGWDFVGYKYGL
jgi:hypothetical protein